MTSGSHTPTAPHTQLRLRLKPKGPPTGHVDGAWWPRSRDLTTELVALAEVLTVRLGRIERVAYALSSWDTAPRKADIDGRRIRLEGFTYQDDNIIHVTGSSRHRITLLVVPPDMTETAGHDAMMTAGHRGNTDRPEEILASAAVPAPRQSEYSAQRWESDGGHVATRG
jgi:hypothetical protein